MTTFSLESKAAGIPFLCKYYFFHLIEFNTLYFKLQLELALCNTKCHTVTSKSSPMSSDQPFKISSGITFKHQEHLKLNIKWEKTLSSEILNGGSTVCVVHTWA